MSDYGRPRAALVTAIAATLWACGSSESSGTVPGPGSLTPSCQGDCWQQTAADEAFANELCTKIASCCLHIYDSGVPTTESQHHATCVRSLLRQGFSRDASLRAACLEEATAAASTDLCVPRLVPPDPTVACSRLLSEPGGPLAVTQECGAASDCESKPGLTTFCGAPTGSTPYCELWTRGNEGDACTITSTEVGFIGGYATGLVSHYCPREEGLVCLPFEMTTGPHTCQRPLPEGAPCYVAYVCASGHCVQQPNSSVGACAPLPEPHDLPDGASCTEDASCHNHQCEHGICMPYVQFAVQLMFCGP